MPPGGPLHSDAIQDQVELALMRSGEHKIARSYVIYREERARQRAAEDGQPDKPHPSLRVTLPDGSQQPLDLGRLETVINEACAGLADVDPAYVLDEALKNLYDGVPMQELRSEEHTSELQSRGHLVCR